LATELQRRFETLIDQHRRILFRVASMYTANREDRLDVAQEIRIQLWRAFPNYQPERRFSTWMYRIALNVAISHLRQATSRGQRAVPASEEFEAALADIAEPDDHEASEQRQMLYRLIDALEPMNRALVMLYLDQYSHAEIASILGITETNVASKINRIKQRLRTQATALQAPQAQPHQ
jgi:RNA polymerase sigma-70 factor (ECF subfamily)